MADADHVRHWRFVLAALVLLVLLARECRNLLRADDAQRDGLRPIQSWGSPGALWGPFSAPGHQISILVPWGSPGAHIIIVIIVIIIIVIIIIIIILVIIIARPFAPSSPYLVFSFEFIHNWLLFIDC